MPVINEKHDGNIKTVYFEETPIMSTYLVGIVVGRFDYIEDTAADGMHTEPQDCSLTFSNFLML